jgi:hypothetical protein
VKKFDPTKPVQTREGQPARIVASDMKNDVYPIVAIVTMLDGEECVSTHTSEGKFEATCGISMGDLVNIPERRKVWLDIWADGFASGFPTEELARQYASRTSGRIIAVAVPFEYEEPNHD